MSVPNFLIRHWFLLTLPLALGAGALVPWLGAQGGPLHPEITVHVAVAASFLISGLTLSSSALVAALSRVRLHALVQVISFIVAPLLALAAGPALIALGQPVSLADGFLLLACLPTTIASCAIMTRAAGGDEPAALCNATGGNLLGVLATPLLLAVLLGAHVELPFGRILGQLALDVLAPLAIGQLIQRIGGDALAQRSAALKPVSSLAILFIVFTVSCGMFTSHDVTTLGRTAAIVLMLAVLMHATLLALSWWSSGLIGLTRNERIAVLFCASQKTLAIGAPLVAIVHPHQADLTLAMLPMVLYHPVQLLADGIIAARLKTVKPAG